MRPLKRSLSGVEIEVHTLDKRGHISNKADTIVSECKKHEKNISVIKEYPNTIEIQSYPSVKVQNTILNALESFQTLIEIATRNDIVLYPLSVYPGSFNVQNINTFTPYYRFKKKYIHNKMVSCPEENTAAFHYHYTLPRGVFDHKKKFLKFQMAPKIKQTLLDSYNMAIAMDPALITLSQSSPLLNGKYVAKDCRALITRTGKYLPFDGLYSRHPIFGGLPIYKHTVSDLIYAINRRYKKINEIWEKNNIDSSAMKKKGVLSFSWHTVRINKIGTLEQRTMDMNHPKYVIAGTVLMKYINKKIQQDFLRVVPSDIGINEPFKEEGGIVHIPPHTHLRKKLQRWSICDGFENKEVRNYTRRFFRFGKRCTHPKFYNAIRPLENMINRNKSVSDMILKRLKKWGYGRDDHVPDDVCAKLALTSCKQLYKEIEKTKKNIVDIE